MGATEGSPDYKAAQDRISDDDMAKHKRDLEQAAELLRSVDHPNGEALADGLDVLRVRLGEVIVSNALESEVPVAVGDQDYEGGLAVTLPWLPETHSITRIHPHG